MLPHGFWEKVLRRNPDQCWPWLAGTCQGYGTVRAGGKVKKAHRLAYESVHGDIAPGMVVMHSCDNPRCVNPAHLNLGTFGDNARDRDKKGRQVSKRGEAHGMSKLREQQAAEIAAFRDEVNRQIKEFALRFKISESTVRDLLSGRTWKWL